MQIYVENGRSDLIRAECLLVIGVRLARMTEPKDKEEWWLLSSKSKTQIEACRQAWENNPRFYPKVLPQIKRKTASKPRPVITQPRPTVLNPVSEVRIFKSSVYGNFDPAHC